MKLFVKTPNGLQYNLEAQPQDTVGDFKKKIETVVGSDVYPAARQVLVHHGNVLMDCTILDVIKLTENNLILIFMLPEPEAPQNSNVISSSTTPLSTSEVPQPTLDPLGSKYFNYIDELGDGIADLCDSQSKYLDYIDELGDKIADLFDSKPEFNLVDEGTDLTSDFTDSHWALENTSHADSNMVSSNTLEEKPVVDSATVSGDATISGDSPPKPYHAFTIQDFLSPEFCMVEISKYVNSQSFKDLNECLRSLPE